LDRHSIYSVRENYTEMVQLHRRELGRRLVEARGKGKFACIQFDKLIIEGNVYTYDEGTNQIVRIGQIVGMLIQATSIGGTGNVSMYSISNTEHYGGFVYQTTLMIIHAILNYVRSLKSRVLRKKQAYQNRNRNKLASSII